MEEFCASYHYFRPLPFKVGLGSLYFHCTYQKKVIYDESSGDAVDHVPQFDRTLGAKGEGLGDFLLREVLL